MSPSSDILYFESVTDNFHIRKAMLHLALIEHLFRMEGG